MQDPVEPDNCLCNTNKGRSGASVSDDSKCVCSTYPRPVMDDNNVGPVVYRNVYYVCNCGTDPNQNNNMQCCTTSSKGDCNCCMTCKCDCSNGTKSCMCGGSDAQSPSCSGTQRGTGNVCYTFDKTCCGSKHTESPTSDIIRKHHGPIFIYNSYYYYCQCKSNKGLRQPTTCGTQCTCGCQAKTSTEMSGQKSDNENKGFGSTKQPQVFTQTQNANLGKTEPIKTETAPVQSQQRQNPSQFKSNNPNNAESTANGAHKPRIDLSELFRHLKK